MPRFEGEFTIADATEWIGREMVLSDWLEIDQEKVTAFGELTNHLHWLHLDVPRSEREGPYGGTIAQGFLMLNFILHFIEQTGLRPSDSVFNLNYGFDRVRFVKPVVVKDGFRLRDRISMLDATNRDDGRCLMKTAHEMEIEGEDDIAVYAEWLTLWVPKGNA